MLGIDAIVNIIVISQYVFLDVLWLIVQVDFNVGLVDFVVDRGFPLIVPVK